MRYASPLCFFVPAAFAAVLAFAASGCTYETIVYKTVVNSQDTGSDDDPDADVDTTDEDTAADSESEDTMVENVPGIDYVPGASDTAVEAPVCEYVTSTWDGDIALRNNLVVSLHDPQPSHEAVEGVSDVLVLDFTATDPDCNDILVTGFSLRTYWTDIADSGWYPSWVGMSIDGELVDGVSIGGGIADGTTTYPPIYEQFVVPAGETVTATFSAEMYGASVIDDDAIVFGLYVGSLGVYDGVNLVTLHNAALDGNTLVF